MTITGDLWSEGDVQVDGHICGNVNCAQLMVGRDAAITGAIMAEEVVVRGRVMGTIRAIRVRLQSTARVESEIIYRVLSIDEGARFEGAARCRSNPLRAEAAVSPMTEMRQMMAEVGRVNGAAARSKNQAKKSSADDGRAIVPRKRRDSKQKPRRLPETTGAVMFRLPET
jgi:cytoskeletal protein CcmA (bactofilin family)